jgi:glycosyltransferase involved in cell wall biosynthesis
MRLAVVMNQKSPWARETVLKLTELGADVHVIDFATKPRVAEYLASQAARDVKALELFQRRVAGVHLLRSRFASEVRYLTCARDVARICHRVKAECLLTLYGGGSSLMAWASGVRPYAVYTVGSDILLARKIRRWLTRVSLEDANIVLSNGIHLAARTQQLAPRARVLPLYLGIDTTRFAPIARENNGEIRMLSTRGFIPVYNNESIVRALGLIGRTETPLRITFVSAGPTLPQVLALAERTLSNKEFVKTEFLGGVNADEIVEQIQHADIYLSMSRSDGTSTSLLEAFAGGAFPVVSDIPANREWIDPQAKNGLLVPLDDDQALADAIGVAVADSELRRRASDHNRKLVIQRAEIGRTMSTLLHVLAETGNSPRDVSRLAPAAART